MIGKACRVACSIIAVLTVFVCSSTGQTPTPRAWLGGSAINNTLLTVGGGTCAGCSGFGGNEVAIVEAYDPVSNSWSMKGSLQGPRFGLTASASNGIVYAIGGTLGFFSTPLSTIKAYDPTSNTWSPKSAMPTARWKLTSSSVNGIIYAIGGGNSGNQNLSTGVLEAYDPATDSWTAKTSMPTARWGLASAAINSNIYAVGGFTGVPSTTLFSTLEAYDTTADSWSTGAAMQTPRMDLAAVAVTTLQGALRYGSLGNKPTKPSFFLFVPGKPAMKVVAQDGTPFSIEHLVSYVNLRVEVRGTEAGDTFRLLGIEKLESPPLP
jgi:hypothetical protein